MEQLELGWEQWKELGSKQHDYNLAFASGNARALQALLSPQEAATMKCVFSSELGDSWARYFPRLGAGALPHQLLISHVLMTHTVMLLW